jgi:NAD(P)-dependent dehydrogenase (short-subunit alcohol dehydrogenase family)
MTLHFNDLATSVTAADPARRADGRFLVGRHAIVTGGGRGIGAAIATELARLGARLTLFGRDELALRAQADQLIADYGASVDTGRCDVSDDESVASAFELAIARAGTPFVLVNNAGQARTAKITETSLELWEQLIGVNLTGSFLCSRAVIPSMLEAGEGRIVNVASTAGLRGYPRLGAYCASKHGVIGLTRALALETAKHGVTVNAICPGYTDTDMARAAEQNIVDRLGGTESEARERLAKTMPIDRLITPEEVAYSVSALLAPEAACITGQAIVLGGEVA